MVTVSDAFYRVLRHHGVKAVFGSSGSNGLGGGVLARLRRVQSPEADLFLGAMTTGRATADVLPRVLPVTDGPCLPSRHLLVDATTTLLTAGAEDAVIRADADPVDVLMGLGGIGLVSARTGRRDLGRRPAALLLDGLRTGQGR
ncbi:hypothetical protein [Streptomyces sp. NPDC001070]